MPAPLSLCFVDFKDWDCDVSTPYSRPIGGSQSALCYLLVELAKRGHRVSLANGAASPRGVSCVSMLRRAALPPDFLRSSDFDAVVVLNGPANHSSLRFGMSAKTLLVLWTQHAHDDPDMAALSRRNVRKRWDKIVCVSDWQRDTCIARYRLDSEQLAVIRNAIGPSFESLFADEAELRARKAGDIRLIYASTPFRGLDVLLDVFPGLAGGRTFDCRFAPPWRSTR